MSRVWDQRIIRATHLLSGPGVDTSSLQFYLKVVQFQKSLYLHVGSKAFAKALAHPPHYALRDRLEIRLLLRLFPNYLTLLMSAAPTDIARAAEQILASPRDVWEALLIQYWQVMPTDPPAADPPTLGIPKAFLQPYAELLTEHSRRMEEDASSDRYCPVCSHRPQVAVIQELGADMRFTLVCSLCANVWAYRSMGCPGCGAQDPAQMVYAADPVMDHVQAQACATCRRYLKSVDLAKEPQSQPLVDDVATTDLDARMVAMGFTKIEVNIVGR